MLLIPWSGYLRPPAGTHDDRCHRTPIQANRRMVSRSAMPSFACHHVRFKSSRRSRTSYRVESANVCVASDTYMQTTLVGCMARAVIKAAGLHNHITYTALLPSSIYTRSQASHPLHLHRNSGHTLTMKLNILSTLVRIPRVYYQLQSATGLSKMLYPSGSDLCLIA